MSDERRIIIPGDTNEGPGPRPHIIGRKLRPVDELYEMIGLRLHLNSPHSATVAALCGPGGFMGLITAIKPMATFPKRADAVGGINHTSPGGIFSISAEDLEKSDPWARIPGTNQAASLLEDL